MTWLRRHWGDISARARGLGTHLQPRERLESLADVPGIERLAEELSSLGYPPVAQASLPSPPELDLQVRRGAADRLESLERWCGSRRAALAVLFEDEDRRSIRNLLRGVVQGASVSARLTGLIPTRDLPERALEELAQQDTTLAVADLLATWGSPYGKALLKPVEAPRDLLRLETALNRCFARRSSEAARRADGHLRGYVQQLIDLENAWAALLLVGQPDDVNRETVFLDGGRELTQPLFDAVVAELEPPRAADRLAEIFGASPLAPVFADYEVTRGRLEVEALIGLIGHYTGEARRDPLGLAFAIAYVLRLRAESLDLRRIIWGVALHAPGAAIVSAMVVSP